MTKIPYRNEKSTGIKNWDQEQQTKDQDFSRKCCLI